MENNLKKEFSSRDVQRMRNIITGKTGDKTQIQTGWETHKRTYSEGDVWEENGKTWTIKNGIKQNITKFDSVKRLVVLPLACPSCQKAFKVNDINKKMWSIHGKCFDCVIDMEAEIKREGKWDEYNHQILNENKNKMLEDLESALESWVDEKSSYVTEAGDVETWEGGNKREIYKEVKDRIAELKKLDIYNKEIL